jgi:formate dehydrogenase accessory protein FdhD
MNSRDRLPLHPATGDDDPPPALWPLTARRMAGGQASSVADTVVEEVPVALIYNGISHAVMLATPADLEEFALGFSLSEGLLATPADLRDLEIVATPLGIEIRLEISAQAFHGFKATRRQLAGRTGCGLCGQESLAQAILPIPPVADRLRIAAGALERAIAQLPARQILHRASGGVHAAAWANPAGELQLVREDVGRHNALDKLIGALHQGRIDPAGGFVVLTSRASHELVYKAAKTGIELLAAVSAPTALAVRNAEKAGLTLVGWLRREAFSIYTGHQRIAP